jgi:hypothetical protein
MMDHSEYGLRRYGAGPDARVMPGTTGTSATPATPRTLGTLGTLGTPATLGTCGNSGAPKGLENLAQASSPGWDFYKAAGLKDRVKRISSAEFQRWRGQFVLSLVMMLAVLQT